MLILGLDFETTGFDFQNDRITEVGAVPWDTVTSTPVRLVSTLVKHADAPPISPDTVRAVIADVWRTFRNKSREPQEPGQR